METNLYENSIKIETPVETAIRSITRSPLSIIAAALLLLCSAALDVFSLNSHVTTALLVLNLVAVCVSAGVKNISFRKAIALTDFIVFTVLSVNNIMHLIFPNNDFVVFAKGSFKLMLLPEADFLGSGTSCETAFTLYLAVCFLLRLITDSHLRSATVKNIPVRGGHIFCGIFMVVLSVNALYCGLSTALNGIPKYLILPDHTTYIIMYTVSAVFGVLAVAFLLETIVCFKNFSKLRKTENAF